MIEHEAEIRVEVENLRKNYDSMLHDMQTVGDYIDYIKTSMDDNKLRLERELADQVANEDQMKRTREKVEWGLTSCRDS